jgi:hypothetical protein
MRQCGAAPPRIREAAHSDAAAAGRMGDRGSIIPVGGAGWVWAWCCPPRDLPWVVMSAAQGSCRVQRVVERGRESWTVIGADRRAVEPVEAFLGWLTDTERSPNTVRAYAGDLRQFWEFLDVRGYEWANLGVEELGDFASWLRSPAHNVVVLPGGASARGASTVNRKLAAVAAFYDFQHRQSGVLVAERLHPPWHRSGRGPFKPLLQGFAPLRARGRPGRLPERRRLPQVLALSQVEAILRAQRRCVTGSCSRCCSRRGCGSGRRLGCGMGMS